MKKMLLVLAVVVVGSLAANAKVFNFSFDGFCDQMETVRYSPNPGVIPVVFLKGQHDFTPCGGGFVNIGGFKHGNNANIPPNVAPVDDYSDPTEGLYGINYSLQYLVHEPTLSAGCVWANYIGNGNGNYLLFTGTCTKFSGAAPQKGPGLSSTVKR